MVDLTASIQNQGKRNAENGGKRWRARDRLRGEQGLRSDSGVKTKKMKP